jgi:hypothetical protein
VSGGIIFDFYALAFAAFVGGMVGLVYAVRSHRGPRPYDWETDGEADNRSHPRILS